MEYDEQFMNVHLKIITLANEIVKMQQNKNVKPSKEKRYRTTLNNQS